MSTGSSSLSPTRQLYQSPLPATERLTVEPAKLRKDLVYLTAVHEAVKAGLEQAREAKAVGSSLQCSVLIDTADEQVTSILEEYIDELDAIFVVSEVQLKSEPAESQSAWRYSRDIELLEGSVGGTVHVLPPRLQKCTRCWRYLAEQPDGLCGRCEDAVGDVATAG